MLEIRMTSQITSNLKKNKKNKNMLETMQITLKKNNKNGAW